MGQIHAALPKQHLFAFIIVLAYFSCPKDQEVKRGNTYQTAQFRIFERPADTLTDRSDSVASHLDHTKS